MQWFLFLGLLLIMVAFGLLLVLLLITEMAKKLASPQDASSTARAAQRDPGNASPIANDASVEMNGIKGAKTPSGPSVSLAEKFALGLFKSRKTKREQPRSGKDSTGAWKNK